MLKYNDNTYKILFNIINKSKLISKKILNSQILLSFVVLYYLHDYNLLKMNIDDFEYIYDNISAMFAITLLQTILIMKLNILL